MRLDGFVAGEDVLQVVNDARSALLEDGFFFGPEFNKSSGGVGVTIDIVLLGDIHFALDEGWRDAAITGFDVNAYFLVADCHGDSLLAVADGEETVRRAKAVKSVLGEIGFAVVVVAKGEGLFGLEQPAEEFITLETVPLPSHVLETHRLLEPLW